MNDLCIIKLRPINIVCFYYLSIVLFIKIGGLVEMSTVIEAGDIIAWHMSYWLPRILSTFMSIPAQSRKVLAVWSLFTFVKHGNDV